VAVAKSSFQTWAKTLATERFHLLCRLAQLIRENTEELARWETLAAGRPIREMHAQVERLSDFYEYFAATARIAEGEVTPFDGPYLNYTLHVPLGVVGLITPWNHP
jgi:phenylacetaldehyde dehydrogenase